MKLYSVIFGDNDDYKTMAQVLKDSVRKNSPKTPLTIKQITTRDNELKAPLHPNFINNARKTKHHNAIVQSCKNGEVIGLLDIDTAVFKDLSSVEDMKFDLAITYRQPNIIPYPLNTGVVFVRVSPKIKKFFKQWYQQVRDFLVDEKEFWKWKQRFGGINQSALGRITSQPIDIELLKLPAEEWNCTQDIMMTKHFDMKKIRVGHIHAYLRRWCMGEKNIPSNDNMTKFINQYRKFLPKGKKNATAQRDVRKPGTVRKTNKRATGKHKAKVTKHPAKAARKKSR